jgi:hypothetical protein
MKKKKHKRRRKSDPWKRPEVIDYVLDCYAGVERDEREGKTIPFYAFLFQESDGAVYIGNSVSFAEHVASVFGFAPTRSDFERVQEILRAAGERLRAEHKRGPARRSIGTIVPKEIKWRVR